MSHHGRRGILEALNDQILSNILERLHDLADRQAWALTCKHFLHIAASCRTSLQLFRVDVLPSVLQRYFNLEHLNLSSCLQLTDDSLLCVGQLAGKRLKSISLAKVSTFTDIGLAALAKECLSLLDMDISHCDQVKDLGAMAIAQISSLETLKLVRCRQITDIGLGYITDGCRKITSLNLKWCLGITDVALKMIGANCKKLRTLDLSYTEITNGGLASITRLELLENLSLVACHSVDDKGLIHLKGGCKSLQKLDVSKCQSVSHIGILGLANGSSPLQQLTLSYCFPITNALLNSLQMFDSLQSIRFDGCDVGGADLACIGQHCRWLKELSLSKCRGVTDAGLSAAVAGCRHLRVLDLTCCRELSDISLFSIGRFCKNLISLKMESCTLISEIGLSMVGDFCHNLEELDFTDTSINDTALKALSKCTALRSLKLGFCFNISDRGLVHLACGCPNMRELDFYRSAGIGDTGVGYIARGCPRLKIFNLSYCTAITDAALESIAQLRELQDLEVRGCTLVSSVGIAKVVKQCRMLFELDVKRCIFFDDTAAFAVGSYGANLRQINLSYCGVTDEGLLAIAKLNCMHNMRLVHLSRVTADGFAGALLAAGSLKKVKLLTKLKQLISAEVIDVLEKRGCRFRWMDKPL